ncbi:MAG: hypothetical protein IMZ61_04780 [Planctomycetes bacterium]|nr:hypothetical protein [Planctomycetota bacterium]
MKMKFGAIVVDGRGKIGGHVASKNRAGSYLRTKVTPVNPNSTSQVVVRGILTTLAIAWRGLLAAQRLQWNNAVSAYAKTDIFGDLRNPSGFNLFQKLNNNLLGVGVAQLSVPPLPTAVASLTTLSATQAPAGATTLTFLPAAIGAADIVIVKATAPISPGKSFVKSEFRRIGWIAQPVGSPFTATTMYNAKFGAPGVAGQKVFFELFIINSTTGQAGAKMQCSCIVT